MPNDSTLPEMQRKGIILGVILENFSKIGSKCLATQDLKWKVELLIKKNV